MNRPTPSSSRIPRLTFSPPVVPLPDALSPHTHTRPTSLYEYSRIPVLESNRRSSFDVSADAALLSSFQYHPVFSSFPGPPSRIPIFAPKAEAEVELELVRLSACKQRPLSERQTLLEDDREQQRRRARCSAPFGTGAGRWVEGNENAFESDCKNKDAHFPEGSPRRALASNIPVPAPSQNTAPITTSNKSASFARDEASSRPSRIPLQAAGSPAADVRAGVAPAPIPAITPRSARESEAEVVVDYNFYQPTTTTTSTTGTGSDSRRLSMSHSHSYSSGCPGSPAATTTALVPDTEADSDPPMSVGAVEFEARPGRQHHDSIGSVSTLSLYSSDEEDDGEPEKEKVDEKVKEKVKVKERMPQLLTSQQREARNSGGGPDESPVCEARASQAAQEGTHAVHSTSAQCSLVVTTQRGLSHNGAAGVNHVSETANKEVKPASSEARVPRLPQPSDTQLRTATTATSLEGTPSGHAQHTQTQTNKKKTAEATVNNHLTDRSPNAHSGTLSTDRIIASSPKAPKKRSEQFAMEISCSPPCLHSAKPLPPAAPPKLHRARESRALSPRHERELHTCQVRQVELRLCPRPLASPRRQRDRPGAANGRRITREINQSSTLKRGPAANRSERSASGNDKIYPSPPSMHSKLLTNGLISDRGVLNEHKPLENGERKKLANGTASRAISVGNLSTLSARREPLVPDTKSPPVPNLSIPQAEARHNDKAPRGGIHRTTSTQRITNLTAYLSSQTASSKQTEAQLNSNNDPERRADGPLSKKNSIRDSAKSKSTMQLCNPSQQLPAKSNLIHELAEPVNSLSQTLHRTLLQSAEAEAPLRQSHAELRKSFQDLLETLGRSPSVSEPPSAASTASKSAEVPDRRAIDSAYEYLSAQAYVAGEHRQMLREYASFARLIHRVYGPQLTQSTLRPCPGSPRPGSPQGALVGPNCNPLTGAETEASATSTTPATPARPHSPQLADHTQKRSPLASPQASLLQTSARQRPATAPHVRLRPALVPVRAQQIFGEQIHRMQLQLARPASINGASNGVDVCV